MLEIKKRCVRAFSYKLLLWFISNSFSTLRKHCITNRNQVISRICYFRFSYYFLDTPHMLHFIFKYHPCYAEDHIRLNIDILKDEFLSRRNKRRGHSYRLYVSIKWISYYHFTDYKISDIFFFTADRRNQIDVEKIKTLDIVEGRKIGYWYIMGVVASEAYSH